MLLKNNFHDENNWAKAIPVCFDEPCLSRFLENTSKADLVLGRPAGVPRIRSLMGNGDHHRWWASDIFMPPASRSMPTSQKCIGMGICRAGLPD